MGSTADKVSGVANQAAGKVKEAAGKATGSTVALMPFMKAPIADQTCSITEKLGLYAKTYSWVTALFPKVHGYISPRSLPYELPE